MEQREIKFRAWDMDNKIMSVGMSLEWFIAGGEEDMEFPATDESLPLRDFIEYRSDFILMQYSTIDDRNTKEIYLGDYIKNESVIGEVVLHSGCFSIRVIKLVMTDCGYNVGSYPALCEFGQNLIIGNIYEHPNLIE